MTPTERPAGRATLETHAADDLRFIRNTMASAAAFTAVPGWAGVFIGVTALGVAGLAGPPANTRLWLGLWLTEAVVAIAVGFAASARKAARFGVPLTSASALRFAGAFVPGLFAGAVLTVMFLREGWAERLPCCWLLLYGASVSSAGAFSVRPVRLMGFGFIALGVCAALLPAWTGDAFMAVGFGLLHIAFGVLIARNYGG